MKQYKTIGKRTASILMVVLIALSLVVTAFSGCGASGSESKADTSSQAADKKDDALEASNKAYANGNVAYRNGKFAEAAKYYAQVIEEDANYEEAQNLIKYSNCVMKVNEQPDCQSAVETIYTELGTKYGEDYEADEMYNLYKDGVVEELEAMLKDGDKKDAKKCAELMTEIGLVDENNEKTVKKALK